MAQNERYDIIVIGGGHAGIEAALAPARMGHSVLLLTLNIDTIGQMSCNPSIGGLAKGHLVKEIDVLGGEIAALADETAIQYRMLNRSKGPAVWSPRSQNDRLQYRDIARKRLGNEKNITLKQEEAREFIVENGTVIGVRTTIGNEYYAQATIVTTGTFLDGLMHIGLEHFPGGRLAENRASLLSESFEKHGITLGRLKTGTSPRVAKNSVDVSHLRMQCGDEKPLPFSFRTAQVDIVQLPCYVTHTNERTHKIIEQNLGRSPLYTGKITGIGPRYCPSIETKIVRFSDRNSHIVFIEPEGRDAGEYYLNGLATSLPYDVQIALLRSIEGMKDAKITRPGYAVEYDFVFPVQLHPNLETKVVKNLFCAGQINGTSGYEEAAAQGIVAGINAALNIRGDKPFILKRYEAYIGVLVDDLITKNTQEPYRMFTSLAEHRLLLRIDNVADRLMHYGVQFGLVDETEYQRCAQQREAIDAEIERLKHTTVTPDIANPILFENNEPSIPQERGGQPLFQLLKRPHIHYRDIAKMNMTNVEDSLAERVEIEVKYEGYIKREEDFIENLKQLEKERIPENFDYEHIQGLSNEAKAKLSVVRPTNLDQASRIQGVSPSDILLLLLHLKKGN
jgi:tRNA uridine 5-carboxymethylaminomethyl modification enzyme